MPGKALIRGFSGRVTEWSGAVQSRAEANLTVVVRTYAEGHYLELQAAGIFMMPIRQSDVLSR
jgi:hypothetical protein